MSNMDETYQDVKNYSAQESKGSAFVKVAPEVEKMEIVGKKEIFVGVDTTLTQLVQYNMEGYDLFFESEIGKFKELSSEMVLELSPINRDRYNVSKGLYENARKNEGFEPTPGLKIEGRLASATARLDIKNRKPGIRYAWIAPHERRAREYEGYVVEENNDIETFMGKDRVSGLHTVGITGDTELILMKTSQDNFKARQAAIGDKSRRRDEAVIPQAIEDFRRSGGKEYIPEKDKAPRPGQPQFTPPNLNPQQ